MLSLAFIFYAQAPSGAAGQREEECVSPFTLKQVDF